MNSVLLFLAGLVTLALSAVFAVPYVIDWNDYHDVFEAQASKLIGRAVDVGGDVSLTLLPTPVLKFESINVADAKGKFDTPFASAKSVSARLSVPPLLRGTIEAKAVEIDQPVINLRIAENGNGNWSNLGGEAADLPFIPKDVAFNAVEISQATINIWREQTDAAQSTSAPSATPAVDDREPDAVIDKLDGVFSARSLQGPFKFTGSFDREGARRSLKLSTGKKDDEGKLRLKGSLSSPGDRQVYSIDGDVQGLGGVPAFKGNFRARLTDHQSSPDEDEPKRDQKPGPRTIATKAPFEVKSELTAGLAGAEFRDMELVITKNNKPQTVRGKLNLKFEKGVVADGAFSSRWVDLDSWFGKTEKTSPDLTKAVTALADELMSRADIVRQGMLRVRLDQAVLAGDLATDVQMVLNARDGKLSVDNLSANLPGDNKLVLDGSLAKNEAGPQFNGPVSLSGRSLSRLLRWAKITDDPETASQTGDYRLEGKLTAGGKELSLAQAKGELFGSSVEGDFLYRGGPQGKFSVTLKSERIDLARVLGSNASARSLWKAFASDKEPAESDRGSGLLGGLGTLHAEADVSVAAITFAGVGDSELEAKLSLSDGALDIRRLSLTSGKDVVLQAGGRLTGLTGTPEGKLTLAVQAGSTKGLAALGGFLDIPSLVDETSDRLQVLVPLQVTAAVDSRKADTRGLDVLVEGTLGKSDLRIKSGLDGSLASWRSSPVTLQGSLKNSTGTHLLQQLRPHLTETDLALFGSGAGEFLFDASGVAETGMKTSLKLMAGGVTWSAAGTTQLTETGSNFTGNVDLNAGSTAGGLALFDITVPPGHGSEPARVSAEVKRTGNSYEFTGVKGELGGAAFAGEVAIEASETKPVVTATLSAKEASLPKLTAPLVAWQARGQSALDIRGVTNVRGYWPESPFDRHSLERVNGTLLLKSQRMRLTGNLYLQEANLKADLADGRLTIQPLEGSFYGGSLSVTGALAVRGNGLALDGQAQVKNIKLERLVTTSDGGPLVTSPANLKLKLTGVGLSPRGLASGLSGSGQLELEGGEIKGFSLGAAHAAASSAQSKKKGGDVDVEELGRRVAENLKNSEMAFSTVKVPFRVSNGVVEFDKIALSDSEGRVTIGSFLQLASLELDSEWALQSADPNSGTKPRVSLVFSGPLQDVGKLKPRIDTAGLARYVTIRKMERDVERLENLEVPGAKPRNTAKKKDQKPQKPITTVDAPVEAPSPEATASITPSPAPVPDAPKKPAPPSPEQQVTQAPEAAPTPPATAPPAVLPPPATEPPAVKEKPLMPVIPGTETPEATSPSTDKKPEGAAAPTAQPPAVAAKPKPEPPPAPAPLPRRKPPVPKPVPAAVAPPAPKPPRPASPAPAPAPNLPWLQQSTPPAAPQQGTAQSPNAPTQLPAPAPGAAAQGQAPGAATPPPPRQPERPFNPFAESPAN